MSKKSKQTTKTEPWGPGKQHILGAQNMLTNVVEGNQGNLQKMSDDLRGYLPGLGAKAFGPNAMVDAGQGYAADVLGGKYLNGNPHLEAMIGSAREGVGNQFNSTFSKAGRTGSFSHGESLAEGLGNAELGLRYGDYEQERNRMGQMAATTPALRAAEFAGADTYNNATQTAAGLPYLGATALAGGTSALMSPYSTSTTTQKQGLGSSLMNLAGMGLAGYSILSDERTKTDIEKVGEAGDGLGIYTYRYKGTDSPQIGVLAQEVAEKRPDALGPRLGKYLTVDMERL